MIRVGAVLYGFCGGGFGRDSYGDKRVEGIGVDWVVARDESGTPWIYNGDPDDLAQYMTPPDD